MSGSLLKVSKLHVRLPCNGGQSQVLAAVDLETESGEILALVGESSSGKTTLALALLAVLPPGARVGEDISYGGRESARGRELSALRWREIALIFQEPGATLDPLRRVGWQIDDVLRKHMNLRKKPRGRKLMSSWLRCISLTLNAAITPTHSN